MSTSEVPLTLKVKGNSLPSPTSSDLSRRERRKVSSLEPHCLGTAQRSAGISHGTMNHATIMPVPVYGNA